MKFTFKTEKPTGKWKSFSYTSHYIKLKGCEIGTINDEAGHKIRLQIIKKDINEDGNPNCEWKWIQLKMEFQSIPETKEWLNTNIEFLLNKYQFPLEK